jgi:HSP20 family protein
MAFDLMPSSFFRFPSLWEDDDRFPMMGSAPSGLSVSEDDKHVYVEAAVPGIAPEDVDITFEKGVLTITAHAVQKEEDKNKKYYFQSKRDYNYSVRVPASAVMDKDPDASVRDGVVTITLPKSEASKPKKVSVKRA